MNEKRKFARAHANIPVSISYKYYHNIITSKDISDGGIFLLNNVEDFFPPPGSVIEVNVMGIMGTPPKPVTATVVRIAEDGIGLKFQEELFSSRQSD